MSKTGSRIGSSQVVSMFPTLVWRMEVKQASRRAIDEAVLAKVRDMRRNLPELAAAESWQSPNDLQTLNEFRDFLSCVREATRAVLRFLAVPDPPFEVTGCWVNVNAPGAPHPRHSHPNNYLSGVYYVRTSEGSDVIFFHDPRPQTNVIRPPVTELNEANTDQVVVKVGDGSLLLFPAWLPHSVPPNESRQNRISVSFNVMFSSYTETMSQPLW